MSVEIITKEDLEQFNSELLEDLLKVLQPNQPRAKQWLKSQDVRKLLNISPGTLQDLRIKGTLRFTRIGDKRKTNSSFAAPSCKMFINLTC